MHLTTKRPKGSVSHLMGNMARATMSLPDEENRKQNADDERGEINAVKRADSPLE